ncbi:MAG: energy transducer TonB [Bacteroidales bacterium]|nr:energy transducer TonB [Bacteroidales bacterium]MCM1147075.1 energy transducer TonB [Bacteroidales bacterium]MCM1205791.1 energy transducer TonB [Bacillota bacterium]MCM1509966.1 energy transducer TonB [Clostridium sp.]
MVTSAPDTPPHYPGGTPVLMTYLSQNLRYPAEAQRKRIQGKVVVGLTIERDGTLTNIRIREYSTNRLLDQEALRVVSTMKRWVPGRKMAVLYGLAHIPIVFRL